MRARAGDPPRTMAQKILAGRCADPMLAGVGGIGMLTMVVSPGMLGQALAQGSIVLRPPRSVQVLLSGRTRPFVCARDIAHELVRRGLGEAVGRIEAAHNAPVVI